MALDISGDYTIWDGGETVTLRQIRPDGTTSVTIANAVNSPLAKSRATFSGVEITGEERVWSINASQTGAVGVALQDLIVDASENRWRVLATDLRTMDTRWYCLCRKQVSSG